MHTGARTIDENAKKKVKYQSNSPFPLAICNEEAKGILARVIQIINANAAS